ncbi:hypothetical protein VZT92_011357 [Zoarces viviparus]|uniref:Interferon-induced protein 44-like n=1 Tax=Zoarces viviparus TaxID=48416 RepID=A0AAW1FBM3_ZOAVI
MDNTSRDCFTKKYATYKIQKGPESFYPFVFNDIMGLGPMKGVLVDDVKLALKGHVKDGYRFNPESSLSKDDKQFSNNSPNLNDKVHVLVCVVPADKSSQMEDETVRKIRDIRMEANHLMIPQVAILTKIDELCPEITDDLKNVYKMTQLKKKVEQFSADMGVPVNCIFPVKNCRSEIHLDSDVDALILSSLKHVVAFGEDGISLHKDSV